MTISVVIPAWNEEACIASSLRRLSAFLRQISDRYELVVVDDGSRDQTATIAQGVEGVRLLRNDKNRGKGYALRRGVLAAKGDYIFVTDADLPYGVTVFRAGLQQLQQGRDVVVGRRINRRKGIRGVCSRVFSYLLTTLHLSDLDCQCGYKGFSGSAAEMFGKTTLNGFALDVELLFLLHQAGYSIGEIRVVEEEEIRPSKIRLWKDPWVMLWQVCQIAYVHRLDKKSRL